MPTQTNINQQTFCPVTVEIACGRGRTVHLTATNKAVFEAAAAAPGVQAHANGGEALVAAILAAPTARGNIREIARFKNGKENDGADGSPAHQWFNRGVLVCVAHMKNGKNNDAADGTAALRGFNEEGRMTIACHFKEGQYNDAADGTAAIQEFGRDGKPYHVMHYKDGKLNDAADGTPAVQNFFDGKLFRSESYKDGVKGKVMDEQQILAARREAAALAQKAAVAARMAKVGIKILP